MSQPDELAMINASPAPERDTPPRGSVLDRACALIHELEWRFDDRDPKKFPKPYSPGDLAELRRLDPQKGYASAGPAFWKLVTEELEERDLVSSWTPDEDLRRWMAIVQGLATLRELLASKPSLGRAMATAKISEARLTRLLRARGLALLDQLRPLAHQLRSKAQPVDWAGAARLVLSDGRSGADHVRQNIASDFYRQQHLDEKNQDAAGA